MKLKQLASDRQTPLYHLLSLPDGAAIFSSYGPNPTIFEYRVDGDIKWELKVGHPKVPPILHNNFIYMVIGSNESTIIKLNRDGRLEASYPIDTLGGCHWNRFLFDEFNRMYYCCTLRNEGNPITKLYCFNEKLKKLAELDIEGGYEF